MISSTPLSRALFSLRGGKLILIAAIALVTGAIPMEAQMVPGMRGIGEAKEMGLDRDHKSRDFSVQEIACSVPANVLWPGEQPNLKFRVTNLTAAPISAEGTIKVIQYGTRGRPGDIWEPLFYQIAEVDSVPVKVVDLAGRASTEITIEPKIPGTFGGYLLVADLEGHGRCFAASLVRSIQPDGGAVQYPAYALDLNGNSEEVARFFKRVGVKGARAEVNVFAPDDTKQWARVAEQCKRLQENEITLMVTSASGSLPMPLGRSRPHLDDEDTFKETKSDLAWLPSADRDYERWIKNLCGTFGWPKGPINAVELWNEPWEGISISGWGADMLRYREIYSAMARGVESARAENGAEVLMGGCGSSSNTVDKFFSDGSGEFLKWLDFCSIHYQTMAATPALMKDFINRKSPRGPVRVWDTESWVANSEDRVGLVIASMHAMGQERAMGVYAGNVYEPQNVTLEDGRKDTIVQAWSSAAAVATSTKFVGQRRFRELLFQNGLPWTFVFDGRPDKSEDDGTVVVAGDLSGCYSRNLLLFRSVYGQANEKPMSELRKALAALPANAPAGQLKALQTQLEGASILSGGSLTITDAKGEFVQSDFYGNPVPPKDGKLTVPLNGYGYYLRTNGQAGSFGRLLEQLRLSRIDGFQPVEIIAHDFTAPLDSDPALRLTITNILNRPITGRLSARLGSRELPSAAQTITLAPNETRIVGAKVQGIANVPENAYPLHAEFDCGLDGKAGHDEVIHANVIAKRTIAVDGKLDDWTGVIPQSLTAEGIGANLTEKAWLPFNKFDDSVSRGMATGYLAYDDRDFYFAARIFDKTPDEGMLRFEKRDDEPYFYPEISKRYDETGTFIKKDKEVENLRFREQALKLPTGQTRSQVVWESVSNSFAFNLSLPAGELHQVAFYLLSWDPLGRHKIMIEVSDAKTGRVLNRQALKDFGDGKYAVYDLAGELRVKVSTNTWLKAVMSGVFFDKAKGTTGASGAAAKFVSIDEYTHGNWKGIYGSEGHVIAGAPGSLPSFARLAFSTEVKKEALKWPEGVRRFSYRKRPDLPAGGPEAHDNVQIAFNVLPPSEKAWLPSPPGTPPRWMMYLDTDYEYAFNQVAPKFGGGTEIWRLLVPGMPRKHFYPRQPKSPFDGPVKTGKLVMRRDGNTRIVEAALPWTEMPEVKKRLDAGEPIKFDFRVNDNGGQSYELATERSVSKANCTAFHNDWQTHWSNELEFGFEK